MHVMQPRSSKGFCYAFFPFIANEQKFPDRYSPPPALKRQEDFRK